jgi:hypothetical protein
LLADLIAGIGIIDTSSEPRQQLATDSSRSSGSNITAVESQRGCPLADSPGTDTAAVVALRGTSSSGGAGSEISSSHARRVSGHFFFFFRPLPVYPSKYCISYELNRNILLCIVSSIGYYLAAKRSCCTVPILSRRHVDCRYGTNQKVPVVGFCV